MRSTTSTERTYDYEIMLKNSIIRLFHFRNGKRVLSSRNMCDFRLVQLVQLRDGISFINFVDFSDQNEKSENSEE